MRRLTMNAQIEMPVQVEEQSALASCACSAFRCIMADPPWEYDEGFPTQTTVNGKFKAVEIKPLPYPSMPLEEIRALPVAQLAGKDCRLWLWTTNRYLPDAFGVMKAWGFSYRQTIVWHKLDGNTGGSVAPCSSEFLLVGVKGKPPIKRRLKSSVFGFAHGKRHSQKASEWHYLIEMVDDEPRLELFARRKRHGWAAWGNEVASDLKMPNDKSSGTPDL